MTRRFRFRSWMLRGHPGAVTRSVKNIIVRAHNGGLIVTSTTDGSHAKTSFHFTKPLGKAVDVGVRDSIAGTPEQRKRLVRFQKFLIKRFGCASFLELFGPDNSFNCKNGRRVTLDEGSALETAHDNHDHIVPGRLIPLPVMPQKVREQLARGLARRRARKAGAKHTLEIQRAARKHNISFPLGLALVSKESNFVNQFGHDRDKFGIIFHGQSGLVPVTRAMVVKYLAFRKRSGRNQGVGLTQLTSPGFQDLAERRGGLDKIAPQLDVGFEVLAGHIRTLGKRKGIGAYNGGRGNPQLDYADDVIAREQKFRAKGVK